jgi:hypothetical protein
MQGQPPQAQQGQWGQPMPPPAGAAGVPYPNPYSQVSSYPTQAQVSTPTQQRQLQQLHPPPQPQVLSAVVKATKDEIIHKPSPKRPRGDAKEKEEQNKKVKQEEGQDEKDKELEI